MAPLRIIPILPTEENLIVERMAALSDGSLLVPYSVSTQVIDKAKGIVVKVTPAGRIDSSFGMNGYKYTARGYSTPSLTSALAVAVQADNKIVVLAGANDRSGDFDTLYLERWLPNGDYDSTFGHNGVEYLSGFGGQLYTTTLLAIKPDGHIIVDYILDDVPYYTQLKRDGAIDSSFGVNGAIIGNTVYNNNPVGLTVLPDNRIVIADQFDLGNYYYKTNLVVYTPNGTVDSSVAGNGIVFISDTVLYRKRYVDMRAYNGKLYVYAEGSNQDLLLRYNYNGTLDNTFGRGGKVYSKTKTNTSNDRKFDIQPDGKIITSLTRNKYYKRYFTNGRLDTSFADSGIFRPSARLSSTNFKIVNNHTYITAEDFFAGDPNYKIFVSAFIAESCPTAQQRTTPQPIPAIKTGGIEVKAYPNPFRNGFTVQLPLTPGMQQSVLRITDLAGRVWLTQTITSGSVTTGKSLPAGTYALQVWQGGTCIYRSTLLKQ